MPLKLIPPQLSGELLQILSDMGHGDELLLADANFPAQSIASHSIVGSSIKVQIDVVTMLDAILHIFPLDNFVTCPASVMKRVDSNQDAPIVSEFALILDKHHSKDGCPVPVNIERVERFTFYERAKRVFCVVHCITEQRLYGNIIITKGVIDDQGKVASPQSVVQKQQSKKKSYNNDVTGEDSLESSKRQKQ
jgi:L-fucose mutarotase